MSDGSFVGVAGCSMSVGAVNGYHDLGGTRMWDIKGDYPGGTVARWAADLTQDNALWLAFAENVDAHPDTGALWWELCTMNGSRQRALENALVVLDSLRSQLPAVSIYVSAQPEYEPVGACKISGLVGPTLMTELADQLVFQQGLLPGPLTGPLDENETQPDRCHANGSGQEKLGRQLLAFFG